MTTYQPVICIIAAAAKTNANLVWAAMDRGPDTFSVPLTSDPAPTTESVVSHYLMADSSTTVEDVQAWQAMANGDLPQINGTWGENGVISAADAQEATSATNLQVYSASGDVTPVQHMLGILAGRGLHKMPEIV